MSQPGDTITLYAPRQTPGGTPAYSRVLSDFVVSRNGILQTPGSFTEIGAPSGSQFSWYSFTVVLPTAIGQQSFSIEPAANAYATDLIPQWYGGELETYDIDALASLTLQQQGIPGVRSAADSSLGDIVDGDSYKSDTLTMPSGKLSPFGITDISAVGITVEAAIMAAPGGTSYPITATVVSGTGPTFTISWDTQAFPALTTATSATWYIDVQCVKTGPPKQIITTNRYSFNQVWQRETRVV